MTFDEVIPPRFVQDHVFAVMKDNMGFRNNGADVLLCDYFHACSYHFSPVALRPLSLIFLILGP